MVHAVNVKGYREMSPRITGMCILTKRCDFSVDLQQSHRIHGTCYGEQDIARSELVVLEDLRMFITTWDDTK